MRPSSAPVAVVGAGITGLATAYALTERGIACRVYERGEPGNGQSGGDSRIFRHAHEDPRLVAFARDSRAVWEAWEEQLGVELISRDGAVALGPAVEEKLAALDAAGVPARMIDAAELAERMPLLAAYDGPAMLDERGGAIRTRTAIQAMTRAAGDAVVRDEVLSVRPTGRGTVEVRSGGTVDEFDRVVVSAGRGTAALARGAGLSLPVRHGAHVRLTYAVHGDPPARLATLQDGSGAFGHTGVYAAPVPGNGQYAVGLGDDVQVREDGTLVDAAGLAALAEGASDYVRRALPGLDPDPVDVRHCYVTELPWSEDGVAVWEHDGLLLLAGHNLFKQAPGLGRALAAAAAGEPLMEELRAESRLGEPR